MKGKGFALYEKVYKPNSKGLSIKEISEFTGVSPATVSQIRNAIEACQSSGEFNPSTSQCIIDWAMKKFNISKVELTAKPEEARETNDELLLEAINLNNKLLKQNTAALERVARAVEHIWSKTEAEV